jgi:hypothetical protein
MAKKHMKKCSTSLDRKKCKSKWKGGGRGQGGEMSQTMYAHMNKKIKIYI